MKKRFLICILTAFALVLTLGLAACSDPESPSGVFGKLETTQEVYAFSAASAGVIIDDMQGGMTGESDVADTEQQPSQPEQQPSEELSGLNRYMAVVGGLLADNGFGMSEQPSDREGFEKKMTLSYKDVAGDSRVYEMYFNEFMLEAEYDDDDEIEENYAIDGILIINGEEYAVHGEREIESEQGESESETEFFVDLGENRRIYVEQSIEEEHDEFEQEFSYSVRENGREVERSTFSYEAEDGETEIKMVTRKDGKTNVLYFEREVEHGRERLILRVDDNSYIVTENADGGYDYQPISRR